MFNLRKRPEKWWNYRFLVKPVYKDNIVEDVYYEMIEVYYNHLGEIVAYSDESQSVFAESSHDLKIFMKQIKEASKRTVLIIDNEGTIRDTKATMSLLDMGDEKEWKKLTNTQK